jgi:hypothetical protein
MSAHPPAYQRAPSNLPAHSCKCASGHRPECQPTRRAPSRLPACRQPPVFQCNTSNLQAHSCKPASTQPSQPARTGKFASARFTSTLAQACHHGHTRAPAHSAQALMSQAASAQPPSAGPLPHCATAQLPAYQCTASTQPAHERQSTSTYLPALAQCRRSTSACPLGRQTGQSTNAHPPVDKHRAGSLLARTSQSFGGYASPCQSIPASLLVRVRQSASANPPVRQRTHANSKA